MEANREIKEKVESEHSFTTGDSSDNESLDLSCNSSPFEEDDNYLEQAVAPYLFEPIDSGSENSNEDDEIDNEQESARIGNTTWCQCGHCVPMESHRESVCCQEQSRMTDLLHDGEEQCITLHPGFEPVCLNRYVLDTAYFQYRQQYSEEIQDTPERFRYTGYRQLACWA